MRKKICVVVNSRANYGRIKSAMQAVQKHPRLRLQLVLGASALLERFGDIRGILRKDGFHPNAEIHTIVEGENPMTMAKSTGLAILELATCFDNLKPDVVVTVADRFETLATAVAASYMNIVLAHTQGGECTGSIDESVRHAITKLAHVHFPATKKAKQNIIRMGEKAETVFLVGCPSMDLLPKVLHPPDRSFFKKYAGVGWPIDPDKPYLVVLQHPVTTEFGNGPMQIRETLAAVTTLGIQTVWLWPNIDAGSDQISKELRKYRETKQDIRIHFYKNFEAHDYYRLLKGAKCFVGNSSSAIREGAHLGLPAVNIGTRQQNREHGKNIVSADYCRWQILNGIRRQIRHGPYRPEKIYGKGNAGKMIANVLAKTNPVLQKKLSYGVYGNE